MDYMEIPAVPKNFLDNLGGAMASPASSAFVATDNNSINNNNNNYRPLPPPLNFHATTNSRALNPSSATSPHHHSIGSATVADHASLAASFPAANLRREQFLPFSNSPNILSKDLMYPSSLGSLRTSDEFSLSGLNDKPKRARKSRSGSNPRKPAFSDPSKLGTDVDLQQYESYQQSGYAPSLPPSLTNTKPKRRRGSSKPEGSVDDPVPENTENLTARKRNTSKGKVQDDSPFSSMSDSTPVLSSKDNNSLKGILGSYGMDPKTLDFIQYMKDAPFEGLISNNFGLGGYVPKQDPASSNSINKSFGFHTTPVMPAVSSRPMNTESLTQPASIPLLTSDNISKKFMPDIQSIPVQEQLEIHASDTKVKPFGYVSANAPMAMVHPSMVQNYPVIPSAEGWPVSTNQSLVSLLTQSGSVEHKFLPGEFKENSWNNRNNSYPQCLQFYPNPALPTTEDPDRSTCSTTNNWFRPAVVNCIPSETSSHTAQVPPLNKFPFKLDFENNTCTEPAEKPAKKDFFLDIDLNNPSPEAEAEAEAVESFAHSSGVVSSSSDVPDKASLALQTRDDASDSVSHQQQLETGIPSCVTEASSASHNVNHESENKQSPQEQDQHETKESPHVESALTYETSITPEKETTAGNVKKEECSEPMVETSTLNARPKLAMLSLPTDEVEDIWNDVPYSPGLEASAGILFQMSRASSLFYKENGQDSGKGSSLQRPAKAPKAMSTHETIGKSSKDSTTAECDENQTRKLQMRDGKQRTVLSHMIGNNSNGPDQLSDSKSPQCQIVGQKSDGKSHTKTFSPSAHKESRVISTIVLKKSSLLKSPIHPSGNKETLTSKVKQSAPGEGPKMVRDSGSKNSYSAHRGPSPYPVKARNSNGCSVKPPRHVLPYVEEVRHGAK